jgi:hypothetical protein
MTAAAVFAAGDDAKDHSFGRRTSHYRVVFIPDCLSSDSTLAQASGNYALPAAEGGAWLAR